MYAPVKNKNSNHWAEGKKFAATVTHWPEGLSAQTLFPYATWKNDHRYFAYDKRMPPNLAPDAFQYAKNEMIIA